MMKCSLWLMAFVLLGTGMVPGQTVKVRTLPVKFSPSALPAQLELLCTEHYNRSSCVHDTATLVHALRQYPAEQLGSWSYLLIPEEEWRQVVRGLGHDPATPAFSLLESRITVFESSLFRPSPERAKQLLEEFGLLGDPLLELAITHEMGHTLCMERDERRADDDGRKLRQGRLPACMAQAGAGRGK